MQLSWLFNLGRIFTILESLEISVHLNIVAFKGVVKLKKMTEILSWLRRHWNINIEFYNTQFLGVHIIEDLTWYHQHHVNRQEGTTAALHLSPAGWKEQVSLYPSSPPSTGEPLRACWPAASLSGTGTVVQQTARPSSGQCTQLQKSSVPLSPPSWIFFPCTMLQ